jgi:hypothetical protein
MQSMHNPIGTMVYEIKFGVIPKQDNGGKDMGTIKHIALGISKDLVIQRPA